MDWTPKRDYMANSVPDACELDAIRKAASLGPRWLALVDMALQHGITGLDLLHPIWSRWSIASGGDQITRQWAEEFSASWASK